MQQISNNSHTSHQSFLLKNWLFEELTKMCMAESEHILDQGICNRSRYRNFIQRLHMLQRCSGYFVDHTLCQAMLCYNTGKYNQALRLVQLSKEKISDPHSIYIEKLLEGDSIHRWVNEGMPIETMLRKRVLRNIRLDNDQYIPELYIECYRDFEDFRHMDIPPLVCAFFLQFLCQQNLGCPEKANDVLCELSLLNKYDDRQHISSSACRALSWQILGICQQMRGEDQAACHSYLMALNQENQCLRAATCIRLGTLLVSYFTDNISAAVLI